VLALPRGGVPVGERVAARLGLALDVFIVRKLGVPGHREYAMGAIASGGVTVLNEETIRGLGIGTETIDAIVSEERRELERRERLYRGDRQPLDLVGSTVVLVDDGVATGSTMRAAIEAVRLLSPASIVVAIPVAARPAVADLNRIADECIVVAMPSPLYAVGRWYDDFTQLTDDDVRFYLGASG